MRRLILRYAVFIFGLYILSLGVMFIIRASLGTSPISSFTYVLSVFTPISLGTATFILNMALIAGQLLLVRGIGTHRDRMEIMMQIPFSVIFALFLDFNAYLTRDITAPGYAGSWGLLLAGCAIQALGVALEIKPDVVTMSAEGFVKYASKRFHRNFGQLKIVFDIFLVTCGLIASLAFCGDIIGIREGTLFAALSVGVFVNFINTAVLGRATGMARAVYHRLHFGHA